MTKLTQKKVNFVWGDKQDAAFQLLKQKLCSAPILALPEESKVFIAYCDASIKGLGAIVDAKREILEALLYRNKCTAFTESQEFKPFLKSEGAYMTFGKVIGLSGPCDYKCVIRLSPGKANVYR
ncbi:putative reverse transcriptase domain-containing protein [Tanacetum coccineum]